MSFNLQQLLIEGEIVVYQTRVSCWSKKMAFSIGILLAPVLVGFLIIYFSAILCQNSVLIVTNKRVIAKNGIFNTKVLEFPLGKIESISVNQGFFASILGFGSVTISGTGGDKTPIEAVIDPNQFQRKFNIAISHLGNNNQAD